MSRASFEQILSGLPVELCCYLSLNLCSCVRVVISDTKKETSRNVLFETAQLSQVRHTQKHVAHVLKGAVSKELNSLYKRLKIPDSRL